MSGRKRSHVFAVTLNNVDWKKDALFNYLVLGLEITRFACGEEHYHKPLDSLTGEPSDEPEGRHHHILLETKESFFLTEIRELMVVFIGDDEHSIDVQCCRSVRNWLVYLSKDDYCPFLHNVRVSELSLFARSKHHAKTTYRYPRRIARDDGFIIAAGQNSRFVIGVIEEHIAELRRRRDHSRTRIEPNRRCDITNDVLSTLQHLYLEGPPGYGKTELIDFCIQGQRVWKCGEPSQFMFGTLTEEFNVILFEDFDIEKYKPYMSTILSLMDSKPVTISKKYEDDKTLVIRAQFIFTSNFPIGSNEHFRRRVKEVYVQHKMFECLGCVSTPLLGIPNFDLEPNGIFEDLARLEEEMSGPFN